MDGLVKLGRKRFKGVYAEIGGFVFSEVIIPKLLGPEIDIDSKQSGLKKNLLCPFCNSEVIDKRQDNSIEIKGLHIPALHLPAFICSNNNPKECRGHTGKMSQRWSYQDDFPNSWYKKSSSNYKKNISKFYLEKTFRQKQAEDNVKVAFFISSLILFFVILFNL